MIIAALGVALALATGHQDASAREPDDAYVTVRRGDSLHKLAARHRVSVADLTAWNKGTVGKNLVIRAGDKIRIGPPTVSAEAPASKATTSASKPTTPASKAPKGPVWREHMTVRRGDTLGKIARRERCTVDDLIAWNGLSAKARIRFGEILEIQRDGTKPSAESIGRASSGSIKHSVWLGRGPGYRLRFPKNAYGTEATVAILKSCAKRVHDRFPGTADILIGDISRPRGGRFPPHQSHQNGRDADVGYYLTGNVQNATMYAVGPGEVDYSKTWALLRCHLRSKKVVRVYMDRKIQQALATHLGSTGQASPAMLTRLFGVMGGHSALIQHAPQHDTHFHVRFACDPDSERCALEDSETPWTLH